MTSPHTSAGEDRGQASCRALAEAPALAEPGQQPEARRGGPVSGLGSHGCPRELCDVGRVT